jgi:hypothetical protein
MPYGPGTYGSQVGRPAKKKKEKQKTANVRRGRTGRKSQTPKRKVKV